MSNYDEWRTATISTVSDKMRLAAQLLEEFNGLYAVDVPSGEWSPQLLRTEADYLARPIPGAAS